MQETAKVIPKLDNCTSASPSLSQVPQPWSQNENTWQKASALQPAFPDLHRITQRFTVWKQAIRSNKSLLVSALAGVASMVLAGLPSQRWRISGSGADVTPVRAEVEFRLRIEDGGCGESWAKLLGAAVLLLLLPAGGESDPSMPGQAVMPGGLSPLPVQDPAVLSAASVAVKAFNRQSNDVYYSKVRRVLSASQQVVAGLMYHLKLELATTTCRKTRGQNVKLNQCAFHQHPQYSKHVICSFKIWDQPWVGPMTVEKQKCRRIQQE
ncbi:cystatin 10-like [Heterodontus francisci]|uniref:cystatin 10-like n=1 Tax=Heterodontus francisci TaxID=7792 RepID=UPI00355C2164